MAFGNDRSRFVDNDFSGKRYSFLKNRFQINMITCVCENVPVQLNENVSEAEVKCRSKFEIAITSQMRMFTMLYCRKRYQSWEVFLLLNVFPNTHQQVYHAYDVYSKRLESENYSIH